MNSENIKRISSVCTMGTPECDDELLLFIRCLRTFHPEMPLIIGCTSSMIKESSKSFTKFCNDKLIEWIPCLDQYKLINRNIMEKETGIWYPSRHTDFMMEKANLMERAMIFRELHCGDNKAAVAFLDCDIVLLSKLPNIPFNTEVALSPHKISSSDEALFGYYNGGFIFASNPLFLYEWRKETQNSRFFDQASLENVAKKFSSNLYEFPPQHNYGYWRFFQSYRKNPIIEAKEFSIKPLGPKLEWTLCYEGSPVGSIHTHFLLKSSKNSRNIRVFNNLIKKWILKCIRPSPNAALGVICSGGISASENLSYKKCFDLSFLSK